MEYLHAGGFTKISDFHAVVAVSTKGYDLLGFFLFGVGGRTCKQITIPWGWAREKIKATKGGYSTSSRWSWEKQSCKTSNQVTICPGQLFFHVIEHA